MLPDGLTIGACLEREDVRDALVATRRRDRSTTLPQGARVGTASLRREALLRRARPDLRIELLRGNVPTRVAKVESGELDATLLAAAGLKRIGLEEQDHGAAAARTISAGLRAGDDRDRMPRGRRAHPRSPRGDRPSRHVAGARLRARLPRGARRLLQDADRRLRPHRGGTAAALRRRRSSPRTAANSTRRAVGRSGATPPRSARGGRARHPPQGALPQFLKRLGIG